MVMLTNVVIKASFSTTGEAAPIAFVKGNVVSFKDSSRIFNAPVKGWSEKVLLFTE